MLACIKEMPYGFGVVARGVIRGEVGEEQVDEVGEEAAAGSFGWEGNPRHFVRENEAVDDESEIEALLECLLKYLIVSDVAPNKERAGDVVMGWAGELAAVSDGERFDGRIGICTSFRTTIRERCSRFLASRSET